MGAEKVLFPAFPELAARGERVVMPPDDQPYDFLYAPDLAHAFWLGLTAEEPLSLYNLASERRTVGDLTRQMREQLPGAEIDVEAPGSPLHVAVMDCRRVVEELGYEPRWTLEAAVEDYIDRAPVSTRT
jgi:nucleoside-diphosphate-sugar epimerase